jgi:ATP-dependent helicase/nuclease subunit B
MGIDVHTTAYGRAAGDALVEVVAKAKGGEPLAPVTVIVASNYVGVHARRRLAAASPHGLVAVNFLTLYRLAELLGAPALAGARRRPVSTPVVTAALGRVVRERPGWFAAVADHPSTAEALLRLYRELADLTPSAFEAVASSTSARTQEVTRVIGETRALLSPSWYDEADLVRAARAAVEADVPFAASLGHVVVHLPQEVSVGAGALIAAVSTRAPVTVIVGCTGDTRADAAVLRSLARMGSSVAAGASAEPAPTASLITASDADAEVRSAVRTVLNAAREGVAFEKMALLYSMASPYARLVSEHLNAAAIPWNGAAAQTLAERVAGRTLRRLLALPSRRYHRSAVFELLAAGPVRGESGAVVPAARWERVSREAGVVEGLDEWRDRLNRFATDARHRADTYETDPDTISRAHYQRDVARDAEELLAFVERLAGELERGRSLTSWAALAAWARGILRDVLGTERARTQWPAGEQAAADRVDEILERLGQVDAVDPSSDLPRFTRALDNELDDDLGRVGRFGEGVLVGSIGTVTGLELELVVVVGVSEGMLPGRVRDDPLLPDTDRERAGAELDHHRSRVDRERRQLLAALAASNQPAVVFAPRGDLRRHTEHVPSRCLEEITEGRVDEASFAASMRTLVFPANETEYRLRVLSTYRGELLKHGLTLADVPLTRGLNLERARRSNEFTRYDGNLSGTAGLPAVIDTVTSATRLQAWAICPHAYFMKYLLGVEAVDNPEELLRISALDKGSLVHDTLDEFFRTVGADLPELGAPWGDAHRAILDEFLATKGDVYKARGLTGRAILWARDSRTLRADLQALLDADVEHRKKAGTISVATEERFGFDDDLPPLTVTLEPGRVMLFRGAIDRVDTLSAGLVVIDYKTGNSRRYSSISATNPIGGGRYLQLPIYALAARAARASEGHDLPVTVKYWFVTRDAGAPREYMFDEEVDRTLLDGLRVIAQGIESGVFPAHPPEPAYRPFVECPYCDPDGLGTADRHRSWLAKRTAPTLAPYLALVGEELDDV